jgi:hypothetical protein
MVTDRLRDIWVVAKVIHSKRLENEALGSSFGFANYLIQYKIHFSWRSWRKQKKPNLIYILLENASALSVPVTYFKR